MQDTPIEATLVPSEPEPTGQKKKSGGYRPGAGRPKGSPNSENRMRYELRRRWLERINAIADKVFEAHEAVALGHFVQVTTPAGDVKVYKRSPNPISLEWMMEHIWGRAPQKLVVDVPLEEDQDLTPDALQAIAAATAYAIPAKRTANIGSEPLPEPVEADSTDSA